MEEAGPGPTAGVHVVVVGVVDPGIEKVMSEELKEVLDRVQFWGIGRQEEQRDVVGEVEIMGGMPSGLVEDNDGMDAVGDLGADFLKM